jgi:hypothetical protein
MLDRDDHWKLPARKLPERLALLMDRPSVSASFAPSCCELENDAVNEKFLGRLGNASRQPEVVDSDPDERLLVNRSPSLKNCLV